MLTALLFLFFIVLFFVSLSISRVWETFDIKLASFHPHRCGTGKIRRKVR